MAPHFSPPRAHPFHGLFTFLQSPCHSQRPPCPSCQLRLPWSSASMSDPNHLWWAPPCAAKAANPTHVVTHPSPALESVRPQPSRSHARPFLAAQLLPHLTFLEDPRVRSVSVGDARAAHLGLSPLLCCAPPRTSFHSPLRTPLLSGSLSSCPRSLSPVCI